MLGIVLGQSKYFVDKLSKDVKRGIDSKLEKGHYPHRALPGYRNDVATRTIQPDPKRFDLVQRAFGLVLSGAHTASEALCRARRQRAEVMAKYFRRQGREQPERVDAKKRVCGPCHVSGVTYRKSFAWYQEIKRRFRIVLMSATTLFKR